MRVKDFTSDPSLMTEHVHTVQRNGNNRLKVIYKNGDVGYWLHGTEVVTYNSLTDTVTLRTRGWYTATTKATINENLPPHLGVFQKDYTWYVHNGKTGETVEFTDGMTLPVN